MEKNLICLVTYTVKDGARAEFWAALSKEGIPTATRAEEGCWKYEYFLPLEEPNKVFLLEIWKDEAAQREHCLTSHFERLQLIKKNFVTEFDMQKFYAEPVL